MRAALVVLAAVALLARAGVVESGFTAAANGGASEFRAAATFPPRPLSPPAVTGVTADGETLTATHGEWARGPERFAVEWLRCDGDACVTVSAGSTRELAADDVGKRMRVRVTATNAGGSATSLSDPTAEVAPLSAPRNVTKPSMTGAALVGQTLTATDGEWSGRRLSVSRRWLRCTSTTCSPIAGETGAAYLVTGDDAGLWIVVQVTAANASGTASAIATTTAAVARATYTQILCADPATGRGVASDGALPAGLRIGGTIPERFDPRPTTRCSPATTSPQVPLATGGTFTTTTPDERIVLEYRLPAETELRGATLYRQGAMSGRWSWAIQTSTVTNLFATPRSDLCSWGSGCTTRGSATDRFAAQNRVDVIPGPLNGFNVTLACDIGAGSRCDADGSQLVRVFGGTVTLRDTATPKVTAKAGGLLDGALQPVEGLDLSATDAGAGLHRVIVTVDGRQVAARLLHDNQGRCVEGHEFAHPQPCPLSLATSLAFDTSTWPATGRLRVLLEDAGRNTTVFVNRELT